MFHSWFFKKLLIIIVSSTCMAYLKCTHIQTHIYSSHMLFVSEFSHSVMSDSLWLHGLQHARLPSPPPTPGAYSNSCPSSQLNVSPHIIQGLTSKHPLPTTQKKTLHMDITTWSIPKSYWSYFLQPKMEKLYTVSKNKTGSWLWLRSWTPYCQIQT